MASNIHVEKLAIFSANAETDEWQIREYIAQNWWTLTKELKNATILFIAGAHGLEDGRLSEPTDSVEVLQVQFSRILKNKYPEIVEDKIKKFIKFEFLNITHFYLDVKTKTINEEALEKSIKKINPQVVVLVICFSRTLELKFLLEGTGIFSQLRMQRDLNLISKGRILTLNETQKKFIELVAEEENIEKRLVYIEGRVGSGKTLLGIQVIKMKLSHYIRKYGLTAQEAQKKLAVIIWISSVSGETLKDQLANELFQEFGKYSTVEFCSYFISEGMVKKRLAEHHSRFLHTIVFIDECQLGYMEFYNARDRWMNTLIDYFGTRVDYINAIQYKDIGKQLGVDAKDVGSHSEEIPERFTSYWRDGKRGTVYCQLRHCQRSCQEVLDLAYFLNAHNGLSRNFAHHVESAYSFRGSIPKWLEVKDIQHFIEFIKASFGPDHDLMILCSKKEKEISELCKENNWRQSPCYNVTGSEASTVIVFNLYEFNYEIFTRARNELIIITTPERTKLKPILEEIKKGIHHDRHCSIYSKLYKKFGYGEPPACEYKSNSKAISKLIQPISFKQAKVEQPILPEGKDEIVKNPFKGQGTKDLIPKSQVETLKLVIPSQSNLVLKEDKSIENVRKSIEMLKKQEEEAREKAKQMQQMLEALQKDKREQIEKQFMSYINKISKEAFDEAVGKIKDDDLTLESVLLEIKSLDLRL